MPTMLRFIESRTWTLDQVISERSVDYYCRFYTVLLPILFKIDSACPPPLGQILVYNIPTCVEVIGSFELAKISENLRTIFKRMKLEIIPNEYLKIVLLHTK